MRSLYASLAAASVLLVGCAGDLGAEQGPSPTCNVSPQDPVGYERVVVETVEEADHNGHRYAFRGPNGEEVEFLYGVASDAGSGLPQQGLLPLASIGAGRLVGSGDDWAFLWHDQFPCDPMSVTAAGLNKKAFVTLLSHTGVTPPKEEEGEGGEEGEGATEGGIEEELEEEEGEVEEGILPPGGPAVEFVAIFATAPEAGGIEPYRDGLVAAAGDNVWLGTVNCWKSLASRLGVPRDRWAAGMSAVTRNELDFFIERYDRVPIFSGPLKKRLSGCETVGSPEAR